MTAVRAGWRCGHCSAGGPSPQPGTGGGGVIKLSLSNLIIIRAGLPGSCPRLWRARQQGSLEHEDVRLLDGGCIEDCKNSCQRRAQKLELLDYLYL